MPASSADPTLDSLMKFDDPTLWEIIDNVPVFDEHTEERKEIVRGADGKPLRDTNGEPKVKKTLVRFDRRRLTEIADASNRRERETGDCCPLIIGHTNPDRPETEQGELVGYARQFRLGQFGPARKLAILSTWYIRKDKVETARKYPRRSVELWELENVLDPISLVIRTPERDLGLLTYERKHGRRIYTMEPPVPDRDERDERDEPREDHPAAKTPPEVTPEPELPEHEDMAAKFAKALWSHPLMRHLARKYAAECGIDPDHPEHYEATPAPAPATPASGTNTTVPSREPARRPDQEEEVRRMTKEQDAIRYSRLEMENKALKERLDALEQSNRQNALQFTRTQRERDLIQLEAEGYQFDRAEELDTVADLDSAKYAKHLDRARKYYRRSPIDAHGEIPVARVADPKGMRDSRTGGQPSRFSKEQRDLALQMVEETGKTYSECLKIVRDAE